MNKRYFVDPYKLGISIGTIAVCLLLCLYNVFRVQFLGFLFLLPALPFLYIAVLYGSILEVDTEGVRCIRLGRTIRTMPWTEIAELGVVGTKVFNRGNPDKTGELYIYFSLVQMEEQERFRMALQWPPREQLYLLYTKERMDFIRPLWFDEVRIYNTGKLKKF